MKLNTIIPNNYKIPSLIITIFPFLIITGPFLPDLGLSLVSIFFLYYIFKDNELNILNDWIFKILIIFFIFLNISALFSENILHALKSSFFYFRFIIFSFGVFYFLKKNPRILDNFFLIMLLTISYVTFDGYIQHFFGFNTLGFEKPVETGRISGIFGSEHILGSYLTKTLPLFCALIFYKNFKNKLKINFLNILVFLICFLVFLSGERAAFFLMILGAFLFLLMNLRIISIYKYIIIFITFLIIIIFSSPDNKFRMLDNMIETMKDNDGKIYMISKIHHSHYTSAYKIFLDKPILGIGPNQFRNHCHKPNYQTGPYSCSSHPHNSYFQILSETGIFGLIYISIIFFYINYLLLKNFINRKNTEPTYYNISNLLLISFFLSLWPLTSTGNFFNNYINIFYYTPLGFFLYFIWKKK